MDLDFTHAIKKSGTMQKITRMCAILTGRYHTIWMKLECHWIIVHPRSFQRESKRRCDAEHLTTKVR